MMSLLVFLLLSTPVRGDLCEVFKHRDFWLTPKTQQRVCRWVPTVIKEAEKNNLEPELLAALITVESGWRHTVVSSASACGLTQVIPKYTGNITRKYSCDQLKNPKTSIRVGAKILRWWIDYHSGDISRGLCSYSSGFRCRGKKPLAAGMRYSKKVLDQKQIIHRVYNTISD